MPIPGSGGASPQKRNPLFAGAGVGEGAEAKAMATAASSLQRLAFVDRPEGAAKPLKDWLQAGDVVLLKASRGIELERLLPLLQGNQS